MLLIVLQHAVTAQAVPFDAALSVKPPTNKTRNRAARKYVFLNRDEVARLGDELPHPYDLQVEFLAHTGPRVSECAGLNIGDVDLIRCEVTVERTRTKRACVARCKNDDCTRGLNRDSKTGERRRASRTTDGRQAHCPACIAACDGGECCWVVGVPKNGKPRLEPVPIPLELAAARRDYLALHPRRDDLDAPFWPGRKIVSRDRNGARSAIDYDQPWTPAVVYKRLFKPAVVGVGLPPAMRLHDLRHSFASMCASGSVPAAQVAVRMGHGNEVVTRTIYTHLFREDTSRYIAARNTGYASRRRTVTPIRREA